MMGDSERMGDERGETESGRKGRGVDEIETSRQTGSRKAERRRATDQVRQKQGAPT